MRLVQRALALDPGYLDADYSDTYFLRCVAIYRAPLELWPNVRRRLDAILARDDTHTAALNELGCYFLIFDHDWRAFDACHEREIAFSSGQSWHFTRAWWLRISGRLEEARKEQRLSEDPEPMDFGRFYMCSARWVHREYDSAIHVARRTLELFPGHADGYYWLAHCLVAKGDYAQGIAAIADSQAVHERQELTALLAVAHARQGNAPKPRRSSRSYSLTSDHGRTLTLTLSRGSTPRSARRNWPWTTCSRPSTIGVSNFSCRTGAACGRIGRGTG
ncbi:MAG: tetratricopeptide repeat protein [Verrucomicrobia bacterium]|nr:tetratricopeptide repeat protein [Verrucomicrobiota bacterium]